MYFLTMGIQLQLGHLCGHFYFSVCVCVCARAGVCVCVKTPTVVCEIWHLLTFLAMDWSMNFVGRCVAQPAPTWSLDWAIWWSGKHATLLAATVLTAMSCMLRQHKTWVQTGGLMEITRNSMCKHIKVAVCVYAYACVYIYNAIY